MVIDAHRPELLLFDLGGVLVEYSGVRDVAPLLRTALSGEEIRRRWAACAHTCAFEIGAIEPVEFADAFVRDWELAVPPARFLAEFRSWTRRLLPGARELLDALRPRYRLAALSNSNATHWDRNTRDLGIEQLFEIALSSHQLRLRKPDAAIYTAALERLQIAPEAVIFFDDVAANVAGAEAAGMRAFQVDGVPALIAYIRSLELLP